MNSLQIEKDIKRVRNGAIGQLVFGLIMIVASLFAIFYFGQHDSCILLLMGVMFAGTCGSSFKLAKRARIRLASQGNYEYIASETANEGEKVQKEAKSSQMEEPSSKVSFTAALIMIVVGAIALGVAFHMWFGSGLQGAVPNFTLFVFGAMFGGLGIFALIAIIVNAILDRKDPTIKHDALSLDAYNKAIRNLNRFMSAKRKKTAKRGEKRHLCPYCGMEKESQDSDCPACGAKE